MQLGVVFPQTEIGDDPALVRAYAETAEDLGYDHILAFDHVLGANKASRPDWRGPYSLDDTFHEPFVLFSYLAGITERIEFATGIVILPQRQTVLVAKQAAALDVLSNGRLRLGVGIGWNEVEFEALGQNFRDRGRRSEEQVELMRRLWTEEAVTFNGCWHTVTDAGLRPLPVQRPIPVWFGGDSDTVLPRIARLGDGWIPRPAPPAEKRAQVERMRALVRDAGRDPEAFGIESWVNAAAGTAPEAWAEEAAALRQAGCSHVSLNTMRAGREPAEHIDAIRRFREAAAKRLNM
jgi:probable F420-dependent oxidoreductase